MEVVVNEHLHFHGVEMDAEGRGGFIIDYGLWIGARQAVSMRGSPIVARSAPDVQNCFLWNYSMLSLKSKVATTF